MKKVYVSAVLAAALSLTALAPRHALAIDGILSFYGTIDDTTCNIAGGGGTTGSDGNFAVTLPTISAPPLPQSHSGEVPFSLVVSGANCTNGKLVSLWIDHTGSPAVTPQGTLRNASSNTNRAEGVEIELLNAANGNKINLAMNTPLDGNSGDVLDANNQPVATIVNNTAALNYIARYYMPGSVTPGVIYTYISFTMQYN